MIIISHGRPANKTGGCKELDLFSRSGMETQVLIIGGGATGTGLARDLALRGIDCIIVERHDLTAGASGANHGLLHSGARYAVVDPSSARECRDESNILKTLACHCIEDTGGLVVAMPEDDENYIANFQPSCEALGIPAKPLTPRDAIGMEPDLSEQIIAAYQVEDASINPFKLCVDNAAHAESLGARLLIHTEVVSFDRTKNRIEAVRLRRLPSGEELTVHAEQVVNTSGAWVNQVAGLAGVNAGAVLSKGTLLVTQTRLTEYVINRLRPPGDGDIIVPGGTVSLIGTTSQRIAHPRDATITFPEVDLIVSEAGKMVPLVSTSRFIRAFSGIRSLSGGGSAAEDRSLSREFTLLDHERDGLENFISLFGGKLTIFRLMAEKGADLVCEKLGISSPCRTREEPLPSSDTGKWIEPREERPRWIRSHSDSDTLICECEMVPLSVVDRLADELAAHDRNVDINAIALRSRVGKGSCQGAFCAFRICGHLYDRGIYQEREGIDELKDFLNRRWFGLRPVLWGRQIVQEELQEAIHCALFNLDLDPLDEGNQSS
jgi:glycerol-3-phosphate dehydrogenase